ncbi:MAG: hypothetical protein ACYTHK_15455 [Planctomycetota bacterium]|jgi:hypothetical protein
MSERLTPAPSRGLFGDLYQFLLRRPAEPTHVEITDEAGREHYGRRIARHLGTPVDDFAVLNIHRIGIEAPPERIMEVIREGEAREFCWPNHLARVRPDGSAASRVSLLGFRFWTLFRLTPMDPDEADANHLLFRSHDGYPIGVFAMFVRPSVRELGEVRESQFFFVVSFNFYGRRHGRFARFLHRIWERIHNRATGNILGRLRRHCEAAPVRA